jgi:two-component system, sensor histidine kinase and response regulator
MPARRSSLRNDSVANLKSSFLTSAKNVPCALDSDLRKLSDATATSSAGDVGPLASRSILVVDSDDESRRILQQTLETWGARAVGVSSATAALLVLRVALLENRPLAAAIIDADLPGMEGVELAKLIRENSKTAALPLVLLNRGETARDEPPARKLGSAAHLSRPVRQSELFRALVNLIEPDTSHIWDHSPTEKGGKADWLWTESPPTQLHVLLVEDHLVTQKVVAHMLRTLGHSVVVAEDESQVLHAMDSESFEAVFVNIEMSRMSGLAALTTVRDREPLTGRRLPVVALAAHGMRGDGDRCLASGFDFWLPKPFRLRDLRRVLDEATQRSSATESLPSLVTRLSIRLGGERTLARELVNSFLATVPGLLDAIDDARANGNMTGLATLAHGLKGSSLTVGANELAAACEHLEAVILGRPRTDSATTESLRTAWERLRSGVSIS